MSHFGPGVIGEEKFAEQQEDATPDAVYGSSVTGSHPSGHPNLELPKTHIHGRAVTGVDPVSPEASALEEALPDTHLHPLNTEDAKVAIAQTDGVETLDRWYLAEQEHPKYAGGRKGVLDALEERKGELTAPAAR